jgi:two-component system LytT family response regulator
MPDIRVLIVDDEPLARRGVRQLLAREPDVTVVGECRAGRDALRALDTLAPDLVFLDVQMPEIDGFAVIRAHGIQRMPAIVFVTAHDEFAVRAFEAQALDYLVKPLNAARFAATMARVRERLQLGTAIKLMSQLSALVSMLPGQTPAPVGPARDTPHHSGRLVVPTASGDLVVDTAAIDWIEADDYYVRIHVGAARHLLRESLSSLAQRLDATQFMRVHRSAIVRLDRVREIETVERGEIVAVLRDGTRVPVGRRRYTQLRALIRGSHQ